MRIANIEDQGKRRVAVSRDGASWLDFSTAFELWELNANKRVMDPLSSIQQLLDSQRFEIELFEKVLEFAASCGFTRTFESPRFRAPFSRPGQIIALARNYSAHARESALPPPYEPIFFCKANTSVIGPDDAVILPPNLGRVEPEIEVAVVVKKEASHVPACAAGDYIAGYTILNDVSAQELQTREIKENYPLFRCKSLPTFTPMGPHLVTVDEPGVCPRLSMRLRVNGELRVSANTKDLTFGVPKLIEFISGYVTLMPGDVITTGCPKAAGAIHPGDELTLEIEKIGVLRNPVKAGTQPCPV